MSKVAALSPAKAVTVLLFLVVAVECSTRRYSPVAYSAAIDCRDLLRDVPPHEAAEVLSRFAPHASRNSRPDTDLLTATPQVFRAISYVSLENSSRSRVQHCQAIYSDRAAAYGNDYVEMPAHCLFSSAASSPSSLPVTKRPTLSGSRVVQTLKNYCIYMGENIASAEAIFKIEEVACKRRYDSALSPSLVNDSCLARLDKPVPLSIRHQPLSWWRPDHHLPSTTEAQLKAALGLSLAGGRLNLQSGNIESPVPLYLVSHSLDYDDGGRRRIVAEGRAIYRHSLEGVIFSSGVLPNNIDTRSGDSGGAVYAYINGKKKLLGVQLAVMNSYGDNLFEEGRQPSPQLRNYNIAVNPHIAATVAGFPYRYQLQR